MQRLERRPDRFSDDKLRQIAQLVDVVIYVQYACNEPSERESVDCSRLIQLARQEMVRRHGEETAARMMAPPEFGTKAQYFGEPRIQLVNPKDVGGSFVSAPLKQLASEKETPSSYPRIVASHVESHIEGLSAADPDFLLCPTGNGVYLQRKYGHGLEYLDMATGVLAVIYSDQEVSDLFSLGAERISASTEKHSVFCCDAGDVILPPTTGYPPIERMNGALWVEEDATFVLVTERNAELAIKSSNAMSFLAWAHPRRNMILVSHRTSDDRDPEPWYFRPNWYELVEFNREGRSFESLVVFADTPERSFKRFDLGGDNELFVTETDSPDAHPVSRSTTIHRLDLDTKKSEPIYSEAAPIRVIGSRPDGLLLLLREEVAKKPCLVQFDARSGTAMDLLEFENEPFAIQCDEGMSRLVYTVGDSSERQFYNIALSENVTPLNALKSS